MQNARLLWRGLIRRPDRSEHDPRLKPSVHKRPFAELIQYFMLRRCIESKNPFRARLLPRMELGHQIDTVPATKADTPKSPNTAPVSKITGQNHQILRVPRTFLFFALLFFSSCSFYLSVLFTTFLFLSLLRFLFWVIPKLRRSEASPLILSFIIHRIWSLWASKKCECTLHKMAWQKVPLQVSGIIHSWMSNRPYKVHL